MESKFNKFVNTLKPIGSFIVKVVIGTLIAGAIIMFLEFNNYNMSQFLPSNFYGNKVLTTEISIENHLLWSKNGQCYFVEPQKSSVSLIRVSDCDKE